jgi:hypothetical protein
MDFQEITPRTRQYPSHGKIIQAGLGNGYFKLPRPSITVVATEGMNSRSLA